MIEVGEYIRTTKGKIEKVKTIHNTRFTDHSKMAYIKKYKEMAPESRILYNGHILIRDIAKHSKKPIELVEVGDYVNGCLIVEISKDPFVKGQINLWTNMILSEGEPFLNEYYKAKILEKDIENILTHEMYEQNCYKVGDIE